MRRLLPGLSKLPSTNPFHLAPITSIFRAPFEMPVALPGARVTAAPALFAYRPFSHVTFPSLAPRRGPAPSNARPRKDKGQEIVSDDAALVDLGVDLPEEPAAAIEPAATTTVRTRLSPTPRLGPAHA